MRPILDVNWRIWDPKSRSSVVGWPRGAPGLRLWAHQRLTASMHEFAQAGFGGLKFAPCQHGGAGIFSGGYDKYDDYNLEDTAFGSAEMLRQCVASAHAHGMDVWGDLVLHQYGGGRGGSYPTRRFPKTALCFASDTTPGGITTADPVPDQQGNFGFGDRAVYERSLPPRYMHDGAIKATQWLTRTVGFDGYRLDAVKGTYVPVIRDLMNADGLSHLPFTAEYFEGSNDPISKWVWGDMKGRPSAYDFGTKFNLRDICNNNSNSWMGRLAEIGYNMVDAFHAVTFTESADTDTSFGQQTIWNKMLAYAVILTFPGQPQVYYRDWSTDPNCYGMKKPINNLMWIRENLAQGDFVPRTNRGDFQAFAMERKGYGDAPGCVAFFNNNQWNPETRTVETSMPAGTYLHEYTGNSGGWLDTRVDERGHLTATIPPNHNGMSYLVFGRPLQARNFAWTPRRTRQEFEGAPDLGRAPTGTCALNGNVIVANIDVHKDSKIDLVLAVDVDGWTSQGTLRLVVQGNSGIISDTALPADGDTIKVSCQSTEAGFYALVLVGAGLPTAGLRFVLTAEYLAPQISVPEPT